MVSPGCPPNIDPDKYWIIDHAFSGLNPAPKSFADIGAVWGIDAAYTFYILDKYGSMPAFIIDGVLTREVRDRARRFNQLKVYQGDITDDSIVKKIGKVDAVILFDVLLHQVNPDWDQVLEMYAPVCEHFLIFNPQYVASHRTVRLLELGLTEYFNSVPHLPTEKNYCELVENIDEVDSQLHRPWRDVRHIWQWGITNKDLVSKMASLGFKPVVKLDGGKYGNALNFYRMGFIFSRR